MKKLFTLMFALSAFAVASFGQSSSNALLYKLTKKGQAQPSYLFGTFHLMCKADLPTDSLLFQALRSTSTLCLEIDVTNTATMMSAMKHMMHTDSLDWQASIAPDTLTLMDSVFKARTKMNLTAMKRMKPFAVMTMMLPSFLPCTAQSLETALANYAKPRGIAMAELETVERQMKAIGATPLPQQVRDLKELMTKPDSSAQALNKMMTLYKSRNLSQLQAMLEEQEAKGGMNMEAMLNSRNREWIPIMQKMMADKPVFFAVGAGHLPGKQGVIELLRKQGYEVAPVW